MRQLIRKPGRPALGLAARHAPQVKAALKGLTVFTYHDVGDSQSAFVRGAGIGIPPALFRRQVEWIANQFEVISANRLLTGGLPVDRRLAMITFDDGWRGTFEQALPILEELRLPSTIFLNMAAIGGAAPLASARLSFRQEDPAFRAAMAAAGFAPPAHRTNGPEDIDALESACAPDSEVGRPAWQGETADERLLQAWDGHPLFAYGNHSFAHWNALAMREEELRRDYRENEARLSAYRSHRPLYAFPNGQWGSCFGPREVAILREEGAARLFGACGSVNPDPNAVLLDRISMLETYTSHSHFWFAVGRSTLLGKPALHRLAGAAA